eukprot:4762419-Pyramimonas_sp.AAC.1
MRISIRPSSDPHPFCELVKRTRRNRRRNKINKFQDGGRLATTTTSTTGVNIKTFAIVHFGGVLETSRGHRRTHSGQCWRPLAPSWGSLE